MRPGTTSWRARAARTTTSRPRSSVPARSIYLKAPRRLGNLGAAIRVAAAADAAAVLTRPRSVAPGAVRGAAGLQFALPVPRVDAPPLGRPLVAVDPGGDQRPVPSTRCSRSAANATG